MTRPFSPLLSESSGAGPTWAHSQEGPFWGYISGEGAQRTGRSVEEGRPPGCDIEAGIALGGRVDERCGPDLVPRRWEAEQLELAWRRADHERVPGRVNRPGLDRVVA